MCCVAEIVVSFWLDDAIWMYGMCLRLDSFCFLVSPTHMLLGGGVIGYATEYRVYIPIAVQP